MAELKPEYVTVLTPEQIIHLQAMAKVKEANAMMLLAHTNPEEYSRLRLEAELAHEAKSSAQI